jgi:class I fructose-bisphosphate aldolase
LKKIKLGKILKNEKALFLAYDQGLEHGPVDFNAHNIDPNYFLFIAVNGGFNGVILQKGIAERYHENYYKKVPLIVKLNGKSNIPRIFPIAKQLCSVKRAVELGADAVGYTIYAGSPLEPEIFKEFSRIQEEAHDYELPVITWMYPRGRFVTNELSTSILAYAARIALELGADIIKIKYNDKKEEFKWVVRCAGKVKVMAAGGPKLPDREFLERAKDIMEAGCSGMAIGREIWQHKSPLKMAAAIKSIIFEDTSPEEAFRLLE